MELRVIRWLNDLIGYGDKSRGNLTSGGMTANFIGLKLGRDYIVRDDSAQHEGMKGGWTAYVSEERHVSLDKAADAAVGIGRKYLRTIPTNDNYQVRIDVLEEAIKKTRHRVWNQFVSLALPAITNLGAVDDLEALSKISKRENAGFTADAAYGGGMLLSNKYPGLLQADLDLADSGWPSTHINGFMHRSMQEPYWWKTTIVWPVSFGMQPSYLTDQSQQKMNATSFMCMGLSNPNVSAV